MRCAGKGRAPEAGTDPRLRAYEGEASRHRLQATQGEFRMSCIDISVCAVPDGRKADYVKHCQMFHGVAKELGAVAVIDTWGTDVPEGKLTDFRKAVKAEPGETVAVGWVIWKDKQARDAAWEKMMQDDRMKNMQMPFDGKRMIFGTYESLIES
jgi:uncharacterized protein YbaA (DUF1428 family)